MCAGLWRCGLLLAVCKGMLCCVLCSLPQPGSRGFPSNSHASAQASLFEGEVAEEMGPFFSFGPLVSNSFLRESRAAGLGFCKGGDKIRETEILRITYQWQSTDKLQGIMLFIVEFGALPRDSMQINLTGVFISANIHSLYQIWYAQFPVCLL